jgi:hypothetical protein
MKVTELSGALLDYWVAKAEGLTVRLSAASDTAILSRSSGGPLPRVNFESYAPSSRWNEGGPIIERDQIYVQPPRDVHYNGGPNAGWKRYDEWTATVSARTRTLPPENELSKMIGHGGVGRGAGETPLIAAMRAKVASHYGDEVPDEGQ